MKKWILLIFCFTAYHSIAQVKIGISAGYNNAVLYIHKEPLTGDYSVKNSAINAFNIGTV